MEQKEIEHVERIEDLTTFPFNNFSEYKKAFAEGTIEPSIDRSVALEWSQKGIYLPDSVKIKSRIFTFLPFIVLIAFVIYNIFGQNWWYLLAIPVLIIAFFILHPSAATVVKPVRSLLILLAIIAFIWSLVTFKEGLLSLSSSIIMLWFSQDSVYRNAVNGIIKAASKHEDLMCKLWQNKALSIVFSNGDKYWVDHKFENGSYVPYEREAL